NTHDYSSFPLMLAIYSAAFAISYSERLLTGSSDGQPDGSGDCHDLAAVQDLSPSRSAYSGGIADPERVRQGGQGQRLVVGQGAQARRWAAVRALWSLCPLLPAAHALVDDPRRGDADPRITTVSPN